MEEKDRLSPDIYIYSDTESNDGRHLPDNQIAVPEEQRRQFHHIGELRSNRSNPKEKEKKINIIGRIGNTVFQNNDSGKVIRGGCSRTICSRDYKDSQKVLRKYERDNHSRSNRQHSPSEQG